MFKNATTPLILLTILAISLAACSNPENPSQYTPVEADGSTVQTEATSETSATGGGTVTFQMDAWADNWFAAYLNDTLIVEDSVSIITERSFNAESVTFSADYPLSLNFILKDFTSYLTLLQEVRKS